MIKVALVTSSPAAHFYRWAHGHLQDRVLYTVVPTVALTADSPFDAIVTDEQILSRRPVITWSDHALAAGRTGKSFVTTPADVVNSRKNGVTCQVQPFCVPRSTNSRVQVGFLVWDSAITRLREEITWEKFSVISSEDDVASCKVLVVNGPPRGGAERLAALTRGLGIPVIVTHQPWFPSEELTEADSVSTNVYHEVKVSLNKSNEYAVSAALARAGMKYHAMSAVTAAVRKAVPQGQPVAKKSAMTPQDVVAAVRRQRKQMPRVYQKPQPQAVHVPYEHVRSEYQPPRVGDIQVPAGFAVTGEVDVSVIVPMFRSAAVVGELVRSWEPRDPKVEFVFVNDACPQNSHQVVAAAWQSMQPHAPLGRLLTLSHNCGFATACNEGAKAARGKILVFLNADTTLTSGWLEPLVAPLRENSEVGIVGNLQLKVDGSIDSAGSTWIDQSRSFEHLGRNIVGGKRVYAPIRPEKSPPDLLQDGERQMVTGCCVALDRNFFWQIGGWDVSYRVGYWEDADLCMRVREAGKKVYFTSQSVIIHKGSHSAAGGHPYMIDNATLFYDRWVENGKLKQLIGI